MKIKSVIKLCKRNRTAILYNQIDDNGEVIQQYIGDGASVFPLDGLPMLEADNIPALFGIAGKDRSKWTILQQLLPHEISVKDTEANEIMMESTGLVVDFGGVKVGAMKADGKTVWFDTAYTEPIDAMEGMFGIYLRKSKTGTRYIVMKRGLELAGIALPFAGKMLGEKIREVAAALTEAYDAEGDRVIGQLEFEWEEE